ncbi:hypothetical protein Pve01_14960 [Planomonospora venezuelensis]|nr:hypothetical protein Pve01_14960 [Planomonospora venezuelensis]
MPRLVGAAPADGARRPSPAAWAFPAWRMAVRSRTGAGDLEEAFLRLIAEREKAGGRL